MDSTEQTGTAIVDEQFATDLTEFIRADVAKGDAPDVAALNSSTDLLLSGLVDSLGVVMIVEWSEQRLGRTIDVVDVILENFQTVDAMVAFLSET